MLTISKSFYIKKYIETLQLALVYGKNDNVLIFRFNLLYVRIELSYCIYSIGIWK